MNPAVAQLDPKAWSTLQARAALAGWTLYRTAGDDGAAVFFASRWGMCRKLEDLDAVDRFLRHLGA